MITDQELHARLGRNLKRARARAKISQPVAGAAIGTTFSQISRYELGQNPITPAMLARLAKLYGCEVAEFFRGLRL